MAVYAVLYHYDATQGEKMDQLRPEHRQFLRTLADQGQVKLVGSWKNDPAPGALIAVLADDAEQALALLDSDPFHVNGLISRREVHEWNIIIGALA